MADASKEALRLAQDARDRAIAAMKDKGFDILTNIENGSVFFKVISLAMGGAELTAFYRDGEDFIQEPVLGFAAVETVHVTDKQMAAGVATRVASMQLFEPLVLGEGGLELAMVTENFLGVALSREDAMQHWGDRLKKNKG